MYLHIGSETIVSEESLIGIFDLDNTSVSKFTREFLRGRQQEGMVVTVAEDISSSAFPPRSASPAGRGKTFAGADSLGRPSTFLSWRHPPFAAGRRGTGWILVNAALCCDFRYLDTCILPARPAGLWFGGYNVKRTRANRTAL